MMRRVLITEMDSSSVNAAASSAEKEYLFTAMPVNRAVISLAVPTVISQIITVVYNMADTFFIGQMNDPNQVAAATISMPLFIFMTALANLFGIGGASLISRSLGIGNRKKLHHALHSAFGRRQEPLCSTELQYSFFVPVCCP